MLHTQSCGFEEKLVFGRHTARVSAASVSAFTAEEGAAASFAAVAHNVFVWEVCVCSRRRQVECLHSWCLKGR